MLNTPKLRFPLLLPLILLTILAAGIGFFMAEVNYDWQGLVLVVAAVGILAIFLVPRLARLETDGFLLKVMVCGLLLKLGGAMVRNWIAFSEYGGQDAARYNSSGTIIAQHIRLFEFEKVVPFLQWGTDFIDFFTGVVYSIVGPTIYGGYLVYAFLSFLGSYCFYKAFRVALPEGNKHLYALLVFLFPSILYWPNGIGKDALIFFSIGLFAYGGAQLTVNRLQGLMPLVLGLLLTLWIRPHIAMILAISFAGAFLFSRRGKQTVRPFTFIIGLLAIGGLVWFILPKTIAYIGLGGLSPEEISSYFQLKQSLTSEARGSGSAFEAMNIVTNPLAFPMAMITLLIRPFPWEAHNLQAVIASLEGVLVMCLILWRIKSLGKAVSSIASSTYLRYILIYTIIFCIALSSTINFGILARQRAMLIPFFLMLIAYDKPKLTVMIKSNDA